MSNGRFDGQVALVTGASRGIGAAIADAFAAAGAKVALVYRSNRSAAEATLKDLAGKTHCLVEADVADPARARQAVDTCVQQLGGLDVVVNNAGIFLHHPPADTDYADWQKAWQVTLDTNLLGPANICHAAGAHMIGQGSGSIINVSSRGAFRGEPDAPAYGASKAGLNSMSQSLAVALAPHGIFVAVVAPGFVDTDMARDSLKGEGGEAIRRQSPLGRVGRPEEIARTVLFLASGEAEFATGTIVDLNGASYLRS